MQSPDSAETFPVILLYHILARMKHFRQHNICENSISGFRRTLNHSLWYLCFFSAAIRANDAINVFFSTDLKGKGPVLNTSGFTFASPFMFTCHRGFELKILVTSFRFRWLLFSSFWPLGSVLLVVGGLKKLWHLHLKASSLSSEAHQ